MILVMNVTLIMVVPGGIITEMGHSTSLAQGSPLRGARANAGQSSQALTDNGEVGGSATEVSPLCTNCVVSTIPVGNYPMGVAYDSGNGDLYVDNNYAASVSVISDSTNTVVTTVPVGSCPYGVAYDSLNGYLYVTDSGCGGGSTVTVIDGATNSVVGSPISVGQDPTGIAFDAANGDLYVANYNSNSLSVISGTTNSVVATLSVGAGPYNVAGDSTNGDIYVANMNADTVSIVSGATNRVIKSVSVGSLPDGITFDSQTSEIYVGNFNSDNLTRISGVTNTVVGSVTLGTTPLGLGFDDLNGDLYVADQGSSTLTIVDGSTNQLVGTIPAGLSSGWCPGNGVAFDVGADSLYVSNDGQDTVSVIALTPPVLHDLTVAASNVTNLAGFSTTFTTSGAPPSVSSYTWEWGDGTSQTSPGNVQTHAYASPGIYLVYVTATDSSGNLYDNLNALLRFPVSSSYLGDGLGNLAQLSGNVVANSTSSTNAQAVISPGSTVVVSNWISNAPTNPETTMGSPTYSLSATALNHAFLANSLTSTSGLSGVTVIFSSSAPAGSYILNFSVPTTTSGVGLAVSACSNFTFTILVAAGGSTTSTSGQKSPNPGTLNVYEVGNLTVQMYSSPLDPQVAYGGLPGALVMNVYQSLIRFNGSQAGPDPTDFVPDLATCVPGSMQCQQLYASTMISGDNWTFVINPSAKFYNGTTGASWSVTPNDVAFSMARGCLYGDSVANAFGILPHSWASPDWVICQALLPTGNNNWDGDLHYIYNSTPSHILSAIQVNATPFCTATMMDGVHGAGCVTFDTSGSGRAWPEFLVLLAGFGSGIASCAALTSQGLGLPGWESGTTCLPAPPGTSPNPNPIPGDTAWDSAENIAQLPAAITNMAHPGVGSGPYYVSQFNNLTGYTLTANPAWGGTTCQGGRIDGCLPRATAGGTPSYIPTVRVIFETTPGPGLAAMANGQADFIDTGRGNSSQVLSETQAGKMATMSTPGITEWWYSVSMYYNQTRADSFMGSMPTLPANATQDLNFRQFLAASFPHVSAMNNQCISSGMSYCISEGGTIPAFMGSYYPTDISWNFGDPDSNPADVGGAAWWWAQTAADNMVGQACTVSAPCTFPFATLASSTGMSNDTSLWVHAIETLSNGAIQPKLVYLDVNTLWDNAVYSPPQDEPFPLFTAGWAPDYFDPSDYVDPILLPPQTYTYETGLYQNLSVNPQFLAKCPGLSWDPTVTESCQGTAYNTLTQLVTQGDGCAPPTCSASQRALLYDLAEHIEQQLGLYVQDYQVTGEITFAPWIDPATIIANPFWGSSGPSEEQSFFMINYTSVIPQGHTLQVAYITMPGAAAGTTVETGEVVLMMISMTGGSGNYTYSWTGLPTGCVSSNEPTIRCKPTSVGSFSIRVLIADNKGNAALTAPATLTVVQQPTISSFAAIPSTVAPDQTSTLVVQATGGIGDLTYSYGGLPAGCVPQNLSSLTCAPTATGSFSMSATIVDSQGMTATAFATLNVSAPTSSLPTITSFAAIPSAVAVGQATNFSVSVSGGVPPYNYTYAGLPPGCDSLNVSTLKCVPSAAGDFTVKVVVIDSSEHAATDTTSLTVASVTVPTLTSVAVSPLTANVQTGKTLSLNATVTCTSNPCPSGVTYAWTLSNSSLGSVSPSDSSATTFTAGSSVGAVAVTVTAALNGVEKAAVAVMTISTVVVPVLTGVTLSFTSATVLTGGTQAITAAPVCAPGPCPSTGLTYAWSLSNTLGSVSPSSGPSTVFTAGSTGGAVAVTATATLNGVDRAAVAVITINSNVVPLLTGVTLSFTSVTVLTGGTQAITATPVCAPGPCPSSGLTYEWSLSSNLGSVNPASGTSTTFTAGSSTGTLTLSVQALLNGTTVKGSAAITIVSTGASGTNSNAVLEDSLLLSVPTMVMVAAIAIVYFMRLGKKPRSSKTTDAEEKETVKPSAEEPTKPSGGDAKGPDNPKTET
jgi:YVTN family beta-propeller protein